MNAIGSSGHRAIGRHTLSDRERRRFERHTIPGDAYAVDESGRELGKVVVAGGGGMAIGLAAGVAAKDFPVGRRLRITVVEPQTRTSHTLDVHVVYQDGSEVGVEFVGAKSPFGK